MEVENKKIYIKTNFVFKIKKAFEINNKNLFRKVIKSQQDKNKNINFLTLIIDYFI